MKTATSPQKRFGTKEDKPPGGSQTPPAGGGQNNNNQPGAGTTNPGTKGGDTELTPEEIQAMVQNAVTEGLKAVLPDGQKGQVTEEGLKTIIADAMKAAQGDSQKLTADGIKGVVEQAVKAQFEELNRREKKPGRNPEDANRIEVPVSWTKGNLPLHGKQLLNILMKRPVNHEIAEKDIQEHMQKGDAIIDRMVKTGRMGKALTSTGSGTGDEFVPTDLSAELQRRMYLSSDLIALLSQNEIAMPSQPYELPLSKTRPTFYLNSSENTATTASDPGSGKITLDAKKLMAEVLFSYELDEDSIIPILPWLLEELGLAAAEAMESAVINGDTAATHQDSDTNGVTNAAEKSYNGFRKLALAITGLKKDLSTGGLSDANLRSLKKALKRWGVKPADLILLCGVNGQNDLEGLSEVSTVDKFGQNATILTGVLPKWRGVPIVTSAGTREDLNASGVFDNTTTTKGSILLINRREFLLGRRREFTVETDRDISKQQTKVVASFRRAFIPRETPSATITTVAIGYNYAA